MSTEAMAFFLTVWCITIAPIVVMFIVVYNSAQKRHAAHVKQFERMCHVLSAQRFVHDAQEAVDVAVALEEQPEEIVPPAAKQVRPRVPHSGEFTIGQDSFTIIRDELGFLEKLDQDGRLVSTGDDDAV